MSLEAIFQEIEAEHKKLPGKTSFYYKNLVSGKTFGLNASVPIIAASVIKLPIMAEFFFQAAEGHGLDAGSIHDDLDTDGLRAKLYRGHIKTGIVGLCRSIRCFGGRPKEKETQKRHDQDPQDCQADADQLGKTKSYNTKSHIHSSRKG